MGKLYTAADILAKFANVEGFVGDIRDWVPAVRTSTRLIPAGIMGLTQFFDQPRNLPFDNVERARELPYRTVILAWSWQAVPDFTDPAVPVAPLIADVATIWEQVEFVYTKDNTNWPSWPAFTLPGAGGINARTAPIAAGAATQNISNGLNASAWRTLYQPITQVVEQNFGVAMRPRTGAAAVALGQDTNIEFNIKTIEARRVI